MRLARTEQHTVWDDDRGASAWLEQFEEQGDEEQLGLLGLDDLQQVLRGVLVVEAAGEWRFGEDERVGLLVSSVVLRQRVAVADVGRLDAVQQHVHAADAQHGVVEIEAVKHLLVEVFAQLLVVQDVRVALAQVLAGRESPRCRTRDRRSDRSAAARSAPPSAG